MLDVEETDVALVLGVYPKAEWEEKMTTVLSRNGGEGVRTRNLNVGVGDFGILLQNAAGARGCGDGLEIPVCVTSKVGAFRRRRNQEGQ